MRKQYHFWPGDDGVDAWDVDRLIDLTQGFPVKQIELDSISEVDTVYWFDGGYHRPTVRNVVEHLEYIRDVDPSYPIILGVDGRVMDGMHRIARALLDGRATIAAVQFETQPDPDHRSCRPEELSYER